ncbi:hypothetical protein ACSBR2_035876 [Camellia fascicularis]
MRRQTSMNGHGGWHPVVRRHGGQAERAIRGNTIYSVFVDNLPTSMGAKGLFQLFSNFGVELDAYIPNKRRKATGSRFGFIKYDCSVAADMALLKANGLWCEDKALKVKMAEFSKVIDTTQSNRQPVQQWREKEGHNTVGVSY